MRIPFSCYAPIQMNQISTPSLPIVTTCLSSVATAARLHLLRILNIKLRSCLPGSSSTKQSSTSRERYGSTAWKLMMQMMTSLSITSRSAQLGMPHRCVYSLVNHVVFINENYFGHILDRRALHYALQRHHERHATAHQIGWIYRRGQIYKHDIRVAPGPRLVHWAGVGLLR